MDISKLTLDEFMCYGNNCYTSPPSISIDDYQRCLDGCFGNEIRNIGEGYKIVELNAGQCGDVALLFKDELVGVYWGEALVIHENHRGKGLSTPLILEAVPNRSSPSRRTFSCPGKKALEKAWHVANGNCPPKWNTDKWP